MQCRSSGWSNKGHVSHWSSHLLTHPLAHLPTHSLTCPHLLAGPLATCQCLPICPCSPTCLFPFLVLVCPPICLLTHMPMLTHLPAHLPTHSPAHTHLLAYWPTYQCSLICPHSPTCLFPVPVRPPIHPAA